MSYISSGDVSDHLGITMSPITSDYTVMFRYRLASFPGSAAICVICTNGAVTDFIQCYINASSGILILQSFLGGVSQSLAVGPFLLPGIDYHIAIVHAQGASTKLYVNGILVVQIAGITHTLDEWAIGNVSQAPTYKANHARSWTAALSAADVLAEMNSLSAVRTADIWDWWILTPPRVDFVDGQINGGSRLLKVQSTPANWTADTDALDPDIASLPILDTNFLSPPWLIFYVSSTVVGGAVRASATGTAADYHYIGRIMTQSQYMKMYNVKVDTDSDVGVVLNSVIGPHLHGYVFIWSAARDQFEIAYADGSGGAFTTLASSATGFTENFTGAVMWGERVGNVLNLYTGDDRTLRVTHTIGGGDTDLLWGHQAIYISAVGATSDVEVPDVEIGNAINSYGCLAWLRA